MVLPSAPGQVGGGNPKEEQEAEGAKGPVGSEDAEDRRRGAYSPGCGDWISSRFFESGWGTFGGRKGAWVCTFEFPTPARMVSRCDMFHAR